MKYRRKAVVEAFRYDGDLMGNNGNYYVPEWAVKAYEDGTMYYGQSAGDGCPAALFIREKRGLYHVSVGDYIIRGIHGELYPCDPAIFEQCYEPADGLEGIGIGNEIGKNGSENKQKILDFLLPAFQATRNLNDLISLTYINEAGFEGVKAEFENGTKYANTAMDSGTAMIKDVLNQII